MTHKCSSVHISNCVQYIPKENKNIDKQTNATKEIAKRLTKKVYFNNINSSLKLFRIMYQTVKKTLSISNDYNGHNQSIYYPLEFTTLHSDCIPLRSFTDTYIRYHDKIKLEKTVSKHYIQSYRKHLLDFCILKTNDVLYLPLQKCYVPKSYDTDSLHYIKSYYNTNIDYFWSGCKLLITDSYYNKVCKIINNNVM